MKHEFGDIVKVYTKNEVLEGAYIPSSESEKEVLFLKLVSNGYNLGINKKEIDKIEIIKKYKKIKKIRHKEHDINKKLPIISILHTGGTIASKVDYRTGAVYSSYNPEELLDMFPELSKIAISNCDSHN